MNTRDTLKINSRGHLEIGGADCVDLVEQFGTPLYVFDEAYIRKMMRVYKQAIDRYYGGNGQVLYASKAFSCKAMYRIADEENIGTFAVDGLTHPHAFYVVYTQNTNARHYAEQFLGKAAQ